MDEFENAIIRGIHISRYIASWNHEGGKINTSFRYWLKQLVIDGEHLTDDEIRRIYNFAKNGKLELQSNASVFLSMCRIAAKET